MKLHCMGGLCNRLQAILSYRAAFPGPLTVEWGDAYQTNGHFLDAFEPLDGVTFVDGPDLPMVHNGGPIILGPDYVADNHTCGHAPAGWVEGYRELRLRRGGWREYPQVPYDAVHIRRTDHVPLATAGGRYTRSAEFEAFIKESARSVIYIATDNALTQARFREYTFARDKCPIVAHLITDRPDPNEHDRRNTPITHAAVDLFACAGAARFQGTALSSFTRTIELFRQMGIR